MFYNWEIYRKKEQSKREENWVKYNKASVENISYLTVSIDIDY